MSMNLNQLAEMNQSSETNSLFAVIQGGKSTGMQTISDVFQQVLGYNQEQMEEMVEALENAESLESPLEVLEEWMEGLQDLLSTIGVQLEEQGFKMNAKSFAENMISINGQEIKNMDDLQLALEGAAEDAEIPVFIQTYIGLQISISKDSEQAQELNMGEDLNQTLRFKQLSATLKLDATQSEDQMKLLAKQFSMIQNAENLPVDLKLVMQDTMKTLQTLAKQFLAISDQAQAPIRAAIDGKPEWAIDAAETGFKSKEIELLAQLADQTLQATQADSGVLAANVLQAAQAEINQSANPSSLESSIVIPKEVNQELKSNFDANGKIIQDNQVKWTSQHSADNSEESNKNGQQDSRREAPSDQRENSEVRASQAKNDLQVPVQFTENLNSQVVEEQSFTQVKTDSKGDLVIEKITQAHHSHAPKHPVVRQVQTHVQIMFDKGESRSTMTLYPENLGKVAIEISIQNDKMQLIVSVDNDKVKAVLESNLSQLKEQLSQNNLHLDKSEVNIEYKNQGQANQNNGKRGNRQNQNHTQDTLLQVDISASEGDETGRRLGYNTMEYLA